MIAKDGTKTGLSGVTLSIGVINALRVKWSERVFSQIRRATEMPSPEIAWEDAEQRLGMAMSTLA